MRIGLNMAALRGYGSSAVGRNILRELVLLAEHRTLYAWVSNTWQPEARLILSAPHRVFGASPGVLSKLWVENVVIRRALAKLGIDKLFSLGDTSLPFAGRAHMLLVQLAYLVTSSGEWGFNSSAVFRGKMRLIDANFAAALPSIDKFTVQTEFMKRGLVERWGIASARVSVIPSSIESWVLEVERRPSVDPYVCYVAASAPQKNHALLAEIMAILLPRWPTLRCRVTVNAHEVPDLVSLASRYGVLSAFDFHGQMTHREAVQMVSGAAAAVLPSRLESFGIPYYEAMAVGCPVVAADRPFSREACGEAGSYADPDDASGFATHIESLLADPVVSRERTTRIRQRFAEVYQPWSAIGASYMRELEAL